MIYVCLECGSPCELIEEDHGGMEDLHGAWEWVPAVVDVTECCHSEEYEERDSE